jgi:hypothetical protein
MAGKAGMHKKLLNPAAMEVIRAKIQSEKIINKLENHILTNDEMSASQVSAALGLLKKTTPDLSALSADVKHTGNVVLTLSSDDAEL